MIVIDIKMSSGIFYSMSLIAYCFIDLLFLYYVDMTIIFLVIMGLMSEKLISLIFFCCTPPKH